MTIAQQTHIQAYQLHAGGTRARMAILRMIAANSVHNRNPATRLDPTDWRKARTYSLKSYEAAFCNSLSQGKNNGETIWYCHDTEPFRGERYANEIRRSIGHTGWYTDIHQDGEARGIVARLTHGRYIAGYEWSANCERVYYDEVFTDEDDAAHMANEHARVFAEKCMEDIEKYEAARQLEDQNEDALQRLVECIALRNRACMAYVRSEARELIETIRANRETLRTEYANYI